jgi:hypothetical protein
MIRIPALAVAASAVFAALAGQNAQRPVNLPLSERIALPAGYASEQDTESDGAFDFAQAPGIRGHILRRFVQPGDDKTSVFDIVGYFAGEIHRQGGIVLKDRLNNLTGRIDGRIPGAKPLWLHVDVSDEGGVIDVLLLEERQPAAREIPVEERAVPGTWSSDVPLGDRLAPIFQPYRGWAWRLVPEGPDRARLFALARSQACAACQVVTDTTPVTIATFDLTQKSAPDIPSRKGAGEVSLYQQQLIERVLAARFKSAGK